MPDLSKEAVNLFWCDYDKRTLYRIVTSMERAESWPVDDVPELDGAFRYLGKVLDEHPQAEIQDLDNLIKILANTHSARTLRIMQYLDSTKAGAASNILAYAEKLTKSEERVANPDPYAEVFLKRNLVFERLQLLARIFSPERINLVLKALEKTDS